MKKILFLFVIIVLTGCASKYQVAPKPNLPVTLESLARNDVKADKLPEAYTSVTASATFWKNTFSERNEDVQGGVYIQQDIFAGESIHIPMTIPVRYYKGPKKGDIVVLKNGRTEYDFFLGEFVGTELTEKETNAERFWVQFGEGEESIVLPFVREDIGRKSTNTTGTLQKINSSAKETLYRIEPFKMAQPVSQADIHYWQSKGFETDGLLVWKTQKGARYHLYNDASGQTWFADNNVLQNFALSMTYFVKDSKDERKQHLPNTKRVGQ